MRMRNQVVARLTAFVLFAGIACAFTGLSPAYADDMTPATTSTDLPPIVFTNNDLEAASELADADELFAGYVDQVFDADAIAASGRQGVAVQKVTRGSLLEGQEKAVYDILAQRICAIAAGEESSSIVEIRLEELGVNHSYTAAELGLESIFDAEKPGAVSEKARAALNGLFNVALLRVLNAMLSDFPYELYWYDKTAGIAFEPPSISAFDNGEGGALVFAQPLTVKFKMYVSPDYSSGGTLGAYVVDTQKTSAASRAAANAQAIVVDHAAESDYDKLHSYLEEVAKLTDYDYDVAENYNMTGVYGNPWQIISVFDGDPSTKVVCEGYAKAFQYLCDSSAFADASIACYNVSGDMYGGTGSGPHMWNIVAMNSKNYLVDITNNDNFPDDPNVVTHTPNDELFMAGAKGSVDEGYYIEWPNAVQGEGPHWISYYYDEETLRSFDEAELRLSSNSYLKDQGGAQHGGETDDDPGSGSGNSGAGIEGKTDNEGGASSTTVPSRDSKSSTVVVNEKTVNAKVLKKVIGTRASVVTTVVLGPKVKKISKRVFKAFSKVKTIVIRTKKLKKPSVRGCLKKSKVKIVRVQVGSAKVNKKYVKKYKKLFTKKVCGKKVGVE